MKTGYFVYILGNWSNRVLYVGFTKNLKGRTLQHRKESGIGFTKKYKVKKLLYFENAADIKTALHREKQLKRWRREWKIELINKTNPQWRDLFETL